MYKLLLVICMLCMSSPVSADWGRRGGGRAPGRGGYSRGGYYGGRRFGRIGHPLFFRLGPAPYGGWRGGPYYMGGYHYSVWAWGPWAPWYGWAPYYGWHIGLGYYVPDGLRCYSDNPQVQGQWMGQERYYASDDAINSALGYCENDPAVLNAGASDSCRIRNCTRW